MAARTPDVQPKVALVREKFLSKFSGSILDDTYDAADVKWVKTSDEFLRCVLRGFKSGGDVDKAVNNIDEILKFRAKWKLSSLKESDINIPANMKSNPAAFYHGTDKQGRKILYIRVSAVNKNVAPAEEIKKYLAYVLNQHYIADCESQTITVFDCSDATVSNFDIEISKFVITCNDTYFPDMTAYVLMFKLGKPLEVIWTVIKAFMNADQKANTHVVSRKNVQNYIAEDQLLPHMLKDDKK